MSVNSTPGGQQPSKYPHLQQDLKNFPQAGMQNTYQSITTTSNVPGGNDHPVFQSMVPGGNAAYTWDSMIQPSMSRNNSSNVAAQPTNGASQSARNVASPSPANYSTAHTPQGQAPFPQVVQTGYGVQTTAQIMSNTTNYLSARAMGPPTQQYNPGMHQIYGAAQGVNHAFTHPNTAYNYPTSPSQIGAPASQPGMLPTMIPLSIGGGQGAPQTSPQNNLQPPEVNIFNSLGAPIFGGPPPTWGAPPGYNPAGSPFAQPPVQPPSYSGYNQQPPQQQFPPQAYGQPYAGQQYAPQQAPAGVDPLAQSIFVEAVFNRYDVNKQGFVGSDQFQKMVTDLYQTIGRPVPTPQAIKMYQYSFDHDGNGVIDKQEWMGLATKLLAAAPQ